MAPGAPWEGRSRCWRIPNVLIVTAVDLAAALNLRFDPSEESQ